MTVTIILCGIDLNWFLSLSIVFHVQLAVYYAHELLHQAIVNYDSIAANQTDECKNASTHLDVDTHIRCYHSTSSFCFFWKFGILKSTSVFMDGNSLDSRRRRNLYANLCNDLFIQIIICVYEYNPGKHGNHWRRADPSALCKIVSQVTSDSKSDSLAFWSL